MVAGSDTAATDFSAHAEFGSPCRASGSTSWIAQTWVGNPPPDMSDGKNEPAKFLQRQRHTIVLPPQPSGIATGKLAYADATAVNGDPGGVRGKTRLYGGTAGANCSGLFAPSDLSAMGLQTLFFRLEAALRSDLGKNYS